MLKVFPRHKLDIKKRDFAAGFLSYCRPLNRSTLNREIRALWDRKHLTISFSVRTALDTILTHLNLPEKSGVLMSAINIKHMVEIVEHHNLSVKAIDLRLEDITIDPVKFEKMITPDTKILIYAQLFGVIVDLKPIAAICKKHNIILIEDCAQGFCGPGYAGSEYADFSLFSFGTIKSTTAFGGAIVTAQSPQMIRNLEMIGNNYPNRGELWFLKRLTKYAVINALMSPRPYGLIVRSLELLGYDVETTINKFSRSFPHGDLIPQIRYRPPRHLLYLLKRRLQQSGNDHFAIRTDRARNFLKKLPVYRAPGKEADQNSFWVLPILSKNPEKLQKELLKHGFDSTRGNHAQVGIVEEGTARLIMDQMIYLPNLANIPECKIKKLARLIGDQSSDQPPAP